MRPHSTLFLLFSLILALGACAEQEAPAPLAPAGTGAVVAALDAAGGTGGGYPLQMGNRWSYEARIEITQIRDGVAEPPEVVERSTEREIVGHQEHFGRCYVEETNTLVEDVGDGEPLVGRTWYRQDRSGLYEADVPQIGFGEAVVSVPSAEGRLARTLDPVERARRALLERAALARRLGAGSVAKGRPGGVLEGEIQRLAYPLRPGQEWTVRDQPLYRSWVDGREILDLPGGRTPAWRVGIHSGLFGPEDEFRFYYGREGYLGLRGHAETEIVDLQGNVVGTMILEDREWLVSAEIRRGVPVPCEEAPPSGPALAQRRD